MRKKLIVAPLVAVLVLFLLAATATPVVADGAKFLPMELRFHDLYQSAQRAVILHESDTQHLILSVQYVGDVEEFAWVIPVPNVPEIDVSDSEVFHELSDFTVRAIPVPRGGGCSPPYPSDGVVVIDEQVVGPYAVAILSADDPNALTDWLNENGYYFPEEGEEIVAEYIEKEWYFVATRIDSVDEETGDALAEGSIEPIVMSFASDEIVYPLRITALNEAPTDVLLYVFADHIVAPDQYDVRVGHNFPGQNVFSLEYGDKVSIEDLSEYEVLPELLSTYLSGDEFYLTKLRGRISADRMVDIDLVQYEDLDSLQALAATNPNGGDIAVLAIVFVPLLGLYLWGRRRGRMPGTGR